MFLPYPQTIVDKLSDDELHDLDLLIESAIEGEFDEGYNSGYSACMFENDVN